MARELAGAERAAVYARIGTTHPGVRHARRAGWSTCSTCSPATSTARAARCSRWPRPGQRNTRGAPGDGPGRDARALGQPRARAARVVRRAAGGLPGRGDRDARRGPGARADHGRRQPGAVHAQQRPARAGARAARLHAGGRHLRERDHPPRGRDPAGARAAGEGPLRPGALPARGPQRRQLLAADPGARRAGRVGDAPAPGRDRRRARGRTPTPTRWTAWSSRRWWRARSPTRTRRSTGRDPAELLAELEPRRGPGAGARPRCCAPAPTATASAPTRRAHPRPARAQPARHRPRAARAAHSRGAAHRRRAGSSWRPRRSWPTCPGCAACARPRRATAGWC